MTRTACTSLPQPVNMGLHKLFFPSGDDAATTNVQFKCTDGSLFGDWRGYGTEMKWGNWKGWELCPGNQVVCGIQTQIEPRQGSGDDSALNGIRLSCCDIVSH